MVVATVERREAATWRERERAELQDFGGDRGASDLIRFDADEAVA